MKILYSILIFLILCIPMTSHAETKEIISEGTYNMGDGETPAVAESRALLKAKQLALEQAGTYVESYSSVEGMVLTKDEIQILASGLMEVQILDKKRTITGDGINFWVKISAKVNPTGMKEMSERVKEKTLIEDYKELQQAYDKSQSQFEKLKRQLAQEKGSAKRKQVEERIADEEKVFQAYQAWSEGYDYAVSGDFDKAIYSYTNAIIFIPNGEDFLNNLDNIRKQGKISLVKKNASTFIDFMVNMLKSRGYVYMEKKQYKKAIEDYDIVITLYPKDAVAYSERGHAHYFLNQFEKAIEDLSIAIAKEPKYYKNYICRGLAYGSTGKMSSAIRDLDKAIALKPDDSHIYYFRGFTYSIQGKLAKAIEDYSKAISLDPMDIKTYMKRGEAYDKSEQYRQALEDYSLVVRLKASHFEAYLRRGYDFVQLREFRNALDDFNKTIALEPNEAKGYLGRGFAYIGLEEWEQAVHDLRKGCDLGDDFSCQTLGKLLKNL